MKRRIENGRTVEATLSELEANGWHITIAMYLLWASGWNGDCINDSVQSYEQRGR